MDNEKLEEFLEAVADRFTAAELVDILEDMGLIDIWTILNNLEDYVIEAKERLEI